MADLPELPAPHSGLARYISENPDKSMIEILEPYRKYEANLRSVYAQDRQNPILNDPHLNVLPLFTDDTKVITTRARNLEAETEEEKSKYIMALPDDKRRPHGSPATVANVTEFQKNFNVFSESSLVDLDWSNVVAAGSSVVNCLLPVPKEFNTTKRKLREYYHEKFCPASDVDLFLYGLTHEQAIEKIKTIEQAIRDALLNEVTVVRTKYAITIASQYPVRHVQIVLRVYKSVSEILTGFDIDAAGGAFDGNQVYVTPRALGSFITQVNHVDLTRRSPSYENRLSKYSHRNFEVYWPDLDRTRIDPTIFERSFQRTLGLARLLVLERLPTTSARETYLNKRREERGRPQVYRGRNVLFGNIKDHHEDEIADWLSEEDVSNYHTFTVPYGQHFNAKRIEKLCYTRDLLLNAEWNQSDDREVYLHRHPAFFGRVQDVVEDCCGYCPKPVTPEEKEVAEKEAEIYIKGEVTFLIDDPGRQQIGSFNPLTEQDWTDMAYVGNTARLCQSIVDGDVDDVLNWLSQEDSDPNKRDYTGRSPLHLAVMTSTPEVVKCLVDHGSRITARLADGKTALHLAASRGNLEMIKILMEKSIENEEAEEERQDRKRQAAKRGDSDGKDEAPEKTHESEALDKSDEESDGELIDAETTDADTVSMVTGSFVNVEKEKETDDDLVPDEQEDEPDYYQIDVLAWDVPCSPLHLAISEGHEDAVKLLCDYGADSILPVKFINKDNDSDTGAILTLALALSLPTDKAKSMAELLLKLGAVSSQADSKGCTAFHRYIESGQRDLIDTLLDTDTMGVKTAINHLVFANHYWDPNAIAPIHSAIETGDTILVLKLLNSGALAQIDFDTWLKAAKVSPSYSNRLGKLEDNQRKFKESTEQPLLAAIRSGNAEVAIKLLENGANPNALPSSTESLIFDEYRRTWNKGRSALDLVRTSLEGLRKYTSKKRRVVKPKEPVGTVEFLEKFKEGTYSYWMVSEQINTAKRTFKNAKERYEKDIKRQKRAELKVEAEKQGAINEVIASFEAIENALLSRGAKTFDELHPDIKTESDRDHRPSREEEAEDKPAKPYEFHFSFQNDREMTETRRDGYIELMEAAWSGDIERIKSLTLQAWGPEQDQPPLVAAVSDNEGNTPFSVAFLRGHHDVARALLEIVKVQWSPPEKEKVRFKMEAREEDEYSDECSDEESNDSGDEPRIVSEKVQQKFTIDDIGHVSMQVKSHTKPVNHLCWNVPSWCMENGNATSFRPTTNYGREGLFTQVLQRDDVAGLKALLDMAQHYAGEKFEGDDRDEDDYIGRFTFPLSDFNYAVQNGKTQMLGLIIKRTGAGIPLDHLVKKSGVELKQKPRYYQGLTVYGKKRNDWATAGRNMVVRTSGQKTPPLLHAAVAGNLESVEFFLGDAPHRLYSEFGKSKAAREDSRLKHLKESPGGFDRAISKWLGADNDFVIHCAVVGQSSRWAIELLEYLVEACPGCLEKKNADGETPLLVACRLGRTDFVKILLKANADQSARNSKGQNILHVAVEDTPKADQLRKLLDLFDPTLRSHLFLQRNNFNENGNTPLHAWVSQASGVQSDDTTVRYHGRRNRYYYRNNNNNNKPYEGEEKNAVEMLKLLLEYSKGEELELLNAAGETCLHTTIMHGMISLTRVMVEFKPRLLYRENAVGRTPAELAHDRLTEQKFQKPENIKQDKHDCVTYLINKKKEDFAAHASPEAHTAEQRRELLAGLGLSNTYSAAEFTQIMRSMGESSTKHKRDNKNLSDSVAKVVVWDLCRTAMEKHPERRRLVSLNEANDVAKRLGEKYSASRYFSIQAKAESEDGEDQEDQEVDFATSRARGASSWIEERDRRGYESDESKEAKKNEEDDDSDLESISSRGSYCGNCREYHRQI